MELNKSNFLTNNIKIESSNIGILAGNSRVGINPEDGKIIIEPQLSAFSAALIFAIDIEKKTGLIPQISIAFDHRGIFRKQFLKEGLTNSQKRNPNLLQLREEIVSVFEPFASRFGMPMNIIKVIHEDSARSHANHLVESGNLPKSIMKWMKSNKKDEDQEVESVYNELSSCQVGATGNKITCAAITSEYYKSALPKNAKILKVFLENHDWSKPDVYVRGALLMERMGFNIDVEIRLVDNDVFMMSQFKNRNVNNKAEE